MIARFPYLANPNNVYPGFPSTQTLLQALRPYPQWNGIPPFLGPPDGNTWYDSLQVKATKRYSHGLSAQLAYTWQKELTNGTNSNTSLRHALAAAHQRRVQQIAGQADFRVQRSAGVDYRVQLHDAQGEWQFERREGAVLDREGLDDWRSAPLSERPNPANAVLVQQSAREPGSRTGQQPGAVGRRLHVHGSGAGTAAVPGESEFQRSIPPSNWC